MCNESICPVKNTDKDKKPGRFQVISQTLTPWIALIFTIIFGIIGVVHNFATQQLTASNLKLATSQVKVSLIPQLLSKDARQRNGALYIAQQVDPLFAAQMASELSKSDPDQGVRNSAISALNSFSQSSQSDIKQIAEKGISQYDVINELKSKGLIQKLHDAQDYINGGAPNSNAEALKIYHEVINKLSDKGKNNLDKKILTRAKEDEKKPDIELAARGYRYLFSEYINELK